jgi:hypothetical protein
MIKQITRFGQVALILNRGNSLIVNKNGVEKNIGPEVKAAWYLGVNGNFQKRITALRLVEPLLEIAKGLRMQLFIVKPERLGGSYYLACVLRNGSSSGMGYCRLNDKGLTHDQKKGLEIITRAANEARMNYAETVLIMEQGKRRSANIEIPADPLLA